MNPFHAIAFDGVKIDLPASEIEPAPAFVRAQSVDALPVDPGDAPRRRLWPVRGIIAALLFMPLVAVSVPRWVLVALGHAQWRSADLLALSLLVAVGLIAHHARRLAPAGRPT